MKPKIKNLYRSAASLYDLENEKVNDDIPFYLDRAKQLAGEVLELACGTGRVTIPLAEAGYNVWGIDLSKEMLQQLKLKLKKLSKDVRQRIYIAHADMCDFQLDRSFSLIIIPFRSFQALTTEEQQRACLSNIQRHLAANGQFIVNVFRPYNKHKGTHFIDASWVQSEKLDWETIDPKTGYKVRRTHIRRKIDLEKQIIYPDLIYYVTKPDGREDRIVEPLAMRYFYEDQLRELLESSGFVIVEEMGYYDKRPISEGPELIFVCKTT